ncbi:MAG TPA: winged helix-turn-helix domain-containing protein [Candidatus Acidoferrales bacterium]|nr:winged helix-turn-helix domain-containing protein [Candidatus Acidoferrales bacterium]
MNLQKTPPAVMRFGAFEVNLEARELRKSGLRMRLEEKPMQILEMLLERPGQVVSRQSLKEKLWPDTIVNFEFGLNTAVNKLRLALGDTAENPRYVETVPKRGYRFIATMDPSAAEGVAPQLVSQDSVAVLPFQNLGASSELEYMCDGVTEAVIHGLSQTHNLRVVAWNTVRRYKGKEVDPRVAGKNLQVRAVLMGKVDQRGDDLAIKAELVAAETGWRLWGHQSTRPAGELLNLQQEIVREVASKLKPLQSDAAPARLPTRYTDNPDAYSDYLKGRYHAHRLSEDAMGESITYFQLAIEKDPKFALAHAGLADTYILLAFTCAYPPNEMIPLARAAAEKALALDENLAEAHASLASITKVDQWDWAAAEHAYRRCLDLNPNDPDARRGYGNFLSALGRTDEAIREIQRAQELDPLSLLIGVEVAWNSYMCRDFVRAREQSLKVLEMEHEFPAALHIFGLACEQLGEDREAVSAFERASALTGAHQTIRASLAYTHGRRGRRDAAAAILEELERAAKQQYVSPYFKAMIHAGSGENRKALDWLEKAVEEHDVWLIWLGREPRWDALRAEPRFRDILRRMKFPE